MWEFNVQKTPKKPEELENLQGRKMAKIRLTLAIHLFTVTSPYGEYTRDKIYSENICRWLESHSYDGEFL